MLGEMCKCVNIYIYIYIYKVYFLHLFPYHSSVPVSCSVKANISYLHVLHKEAMFNFPLHGNHLIK